jgi:hypothetical protein
MISVEATAYMIAEALGARWKARKSKRMRAAPRPRPARTACRRRARWSWRRPRRPRRAAPTRRPPRRRRSLSRPAWRRALPGRRARPARRRGPPTRRQLTALRAPPRCAIEPFLGVAGCTPAWPPVTAPPPAVHGGQAAASQTSGSLRACAVILGRHEQADRTCSRAGPHALCNKGLLLTMCLNQHARLASLRLSASRPAHARPASYVTAMPHTGLAW